MINIFDIHRPEDAGWPETSPVHNNRQAQSDRHNRPAPGGRSIAPAAFAPSPGVSANALPILVADRQGRAVYTNPSFTAAFGYTSADLAGVSAGIIFGPEEKEIARRVLSLGRQGGRIRFEAQTYSRSGRCFWMDCAVCPISGRSRDEQLFLLIFTDITQLKLNEIRRAFYDEPTDLPNRKLFLIEAGQMLKDAEGQKKPLALILISIDQMKTAGKAWVRKTGDVVLKTVSDRLKEQWDGPRGFLGRVSENDLALALADCDTAQALAVAGVIGELSSFPITVGETAVTPIVSLGISLYPANGEDLESLLISAQLMASSAVFTTCLYQINSQPADCL